MSEFSLAVVKKKTQLSSLLLSNFMFFCSLILSHPLYFSYFIFFSPYLFKIFSLLSPLFVTTSLLIILAFFTILRSEAVDDGNDVFECLEELEAYKIVFETSTIVEISENQDAVLDMEPIVDCLQDEASVHKAKTLMIVTYICPEPDDIFEDFSQEKEEGVVEKEVSNAMVSKISDANPKVKANYEDNYNYETMGSMRKEKEWKRTLACKLFEERHNATAGDGGGGDGEGMDLLWETYESTDSSKAKLKSFGSKKGKKGGKNGLGDYYADDEENEYEEDSDGPLCCLQALKFSTGKMNLGMGMGMGRLKFSKAIKGFGWLHHVGSNKHGKKGNY